MSQRSALLLLASFGLLACDSYTYDPNTYFAEDWASTYTQVSDCKKTASHSGPYVTVWVSPDGLEAFNAGEELPEGAVLLKPQYEDSACNEFDLWTVMRKGAEGLAPDTGDWEWQTVYGDGEIAESGQLSFCTGCHKASCEANDLVCTFPQ